MLVLARKLNQEIVIDGNVTVKVIGIRGGTVRLGFEAPQRVSIERKELADRREAEFGTLFDITDGDLESVPDAVA